MNDDIQERSGHFWPIGVEMKWDQFIAIFLPVSLAFAVIAVVLIYFLSPDIQTLLEHNRAAMNKMLRQVLFDYLDYKDQRSRSQKLIYRALMKQSEIPLGESNAYEQLECDRTLVHLKIQKREDEYKFLEKDIEFFEDLHDELKIIEEKLSNHPDRERIEEKRMAEFKREHGIDWLE